MAKLLIYDTEKKTIETFSNHPETAAMPHNKGNTLTLREFRGVSKSSTLWTTVQAMECWNTTRAAYGKPIRVGYAFRRIWEGGHGTRSQHYAGVALDVGQGQAQSERTRIRTLGEQSGIWGYVEPAHMTPTWVHLDRRYNVRGSGYPTLRRGDKGVYVMLLQDALSNLGSVTGSSITGEFDADTERALRAYQGKKGLTADGICGSISWRTISTAVKGAGRKTSAID